MQGVSVGGWMSTRTLMQPQAGVFDASWIKKGHVCWKSSQLLWTRNILAEKNSLVRWFRIAAEVRPTWTLLLLCCLLAGWPWMWYLTAGLFISKMGTRCSSFCVARHTQYMLISPSLLTPMEAESQRSSPVGSCLPNLTNKTPVVETTFLPFVATHWK